MKKILILDDDQELCQLLSKCLTVEGYETSICLDGMSGLRLLESKDFHLVILDVMMPGMDGMKVLKHIREVKNIPVLMLSAKCNEMDKVIALKSGADDYMTKPFSLSELSARVESLVRRFTVLGADTVSEKTYSFGNLIIEGDTKRAYSNGMDLMLTGREFDLLYFLASHAGQIFTKQQIYKRVWQDDILFDENTVMVQIRRLRKKVEPVPETPIYIQTVWGMGYRFLGGGDSL